jgi:hypothetical protein
MNNLPAISCKCITYGRIDTLEESIYSFINQEYDGKKELIIVNDYPLQKIIFDHPDVRIFNLDYTFDTIGAKENYAVSMCSHDIIAVWDDDDIAMPNHLSNIAKYFKPETDLLFWGRGVLFNEPEISAITGLGNSGIVYSRKIWRQIGGHPLENAGYDMTFVYAIQHASNNIVVAEPPDPEVSWFYMWGHRSYHMSGQGTDTKDRPNVILRHADHIEQLRSAGRIPTGNIWITPNWNKEYYKMLQEYSGWIATSQITLPVDSKIVIKSASYGGVDFTGVVARYIETKSLHTLLVPNELFGDPLPNVVKTLHVVYEIDGEEYHATATDDTKKLLNQPPSNFSSSPLEQIYKSMCYTRSDINEHLPTLLKYTEGCTHVTEMGVRAIVSTYAFLMGKPKTMISYDINSCNWQPVREMVKADTNFTFIQADTRTCVIDETDLLFIDTLHNYNQLKIELDQHAHKARKYLIFHDTTTFGENGETEEVGLWPAIEEFLAATSEWVLHERFTNNNGLTILTRK